MYVLARHIWVTVVDSSLNFSLLRLLVKIACEMYTSRELEGPGKRTTRLIKFLLVMLMLTLLSISSSLLIVETVFAFFPQLQQKKGSALLPLYFLSSTHPHATVASVELQSKQQQIRPTPQQPLHETPHAAQDGTVTLDQLIDDRARVGVQAPQQRQRHQRCELGKLVAAQVKTAAARRHLFLMHKPGKQLFEETSVVLVEFRCLGVGAFGVVDQSGHQQHELGQRTVRRHG